MRVTLLTLIATMALTIAVPGAANDKTIWECRTANPSAEPILYLVEWGNRSYVKFSYMRFAAHYETAEDYQGWYWHNDGSGYYRYALILGADGKAWYHDFGVSNGAEESTPLDYFSCRVSGDD